MMREKGPAWHNSLFEDNAEFGFGMALAQNTARSRLKDYVNEIKSAASDENFKFSACDNYLKNF